MVERGPRRLSRTLSLIVGAAMGGILGAACLAAALSDVRVPSGGQDLLPLRPAAVGPEASGEASAAARSVRSFLLLERAGLHRQMSGFVTTRARRAWFRPDSWENAGRLVRFELAADEVTRAPGSAAADAGRPAWAVPALETHSRGDDRTLTRRFLYRVVVENGAWLIDDYEVGPAEAGR